MQSIDDSTSLKNKKDEISLFAGFYDSYSSRRNIDSLTELFALNEDKHSDNINVIQSPIENNITNFDHDSMTKKSNNDNITTSISGFEPFDSNFFEVSDFIDSISFFFDPNQKLQENFEEKECLIKKLDGSYDFYSFPFNISEENFPTTSFADYESLEKVVELENVCTVFVEKESKVKPELTNKYLRHPQKAGRIPKSISKKSGKNNELLDILEDINLYCEFPSPLPGCEREDTLSTTSHPKIENIAEIENVDLKKEVEDEHESPFIAGQAEIYYFDGKEVSVVPKHPSHYLLEERYFTKTKFLQFRRYCLEDRVANGPKHSTQFRTLFRFYSYFLRRKFLPSLYVDFVNLAVKDYAHFNYGFECLMRFYSYSLEKKYNRLLFNDFMAHVLFDVQHGSLYALEKFVTFLKYRTYPQKLNIPFRLQQWLNRYPTLESFEEERRLKKGENQSKKKSKKIKPKSFFRQ
eukprot:TRINITY_DN1843_c0_g2_i1.p1 TRINITY_DN1843_c0_g2~~TRINITY_DN1843_c0_g2_i1.p1  ORF type:complete len:465 (-),score=131.68 TRINITY_DN1843_c0_g2_i1:100-1494(-)